MPCIWGRHNKSQLFVPVAIIPVDLLKAMQTAKNDTQANIAVFNALIDTGAQSTCITKKVADTVGLKPIGQVPVIGVSGHAFHNNYLFHVAFIMKSKAQQQQQTEIISGMQIYKRQIQGAELNFDGRGFDVLLGMDIIGTGSLAVEGSGTFSFSF